MLFVISLLLSGLIIGALARLAVPGPDPMPIWATIALGLAGAVVGGLVVRVVFGGTGVSLIGSVLCAMLLLIGYRRFVQKRPVWGPGAHRPPPS
jgi:uncharacterized membrane protein YeaQ/YmgE (transglycosylase-associated protein family)